MEIKTSIVIQRDGNDLELYIFGDAEPYTPPCFRGHPDNHTPGEGGCASVEGIFLDEDANKRWEGKLTKEEEAEAESALESACEDHIRDGAEYAAEAKAEAQMDDWDNDDYGDYGPDASDF